jgi:hypothetical protein
MVFSVTFEQILQIITLGSKPSAHIHEMIRNISTWNREDFSPSRVESTETIFNTAQKIEAEYANNDINIIDEIESFKYR